MPRIAHRTAPFRLVALVLPLAMLVFATPGEAVLVVTEDEWIFSNRAFEDPDVTIQSSTLSFILNICDWFANGGTGRFLVYSDNFGLRESDLATVVTSLPGLPHHSWTVSTSGPFDLATLSTYDGVFLAGTANGGVPDNQVLIQYIEAGGDVYLAGGTAGAGGYVDAAAEAAAWAPLLNHFGLAFTGFYAYDLPGVLQLPSEITSVHPLFRNQGLDEVRHLFEWGPQAINDLDSTDPSQVLLEHRLDESGGIAVPEPSIPAAIATGIAVILAAAFRRRRFGADAQGARGVRSRPSSATGPL